MDYDQFQLMFNRLPAAGWLDEHEARLLLETALATSGDIAEFGCYQGRSACLLAQLGRRLWCVDPWDDHFDSDLKGDDIKARFDFNIQLVMKQCFPWKNPYEDIIVCRMRVEEWLPQNCGLVYCDGDHTYKGTIAQLYKAMDCNPTYIAVHDVNNSGGGLEVKRAALHILGRWTQRENRLAIWDIARRGAP